jgi:hypothetical protein
MTMQDKYTGEAGTYIVDGAAGIRYPAEDDALYQFDPAAYRADPDAARDAFEKTKAQPKNKRLAAQPEHNQLETE